MSSNYVAEQEKSQLHLIKYCAIYIRVSDEKQADKVSPEQQEVDCKELAKQRGYTIVETYRDIKPYKGSNGRMKQCASYHWDRPQWLKMIADAKTGKFGTILAWKEDRLYRGVNKALLDFSNLVTEYRINVELVKDYYDVKTAPVKAWAAGMELDARHDRTTMGIKAKLAQGKHWNTGYIYGYIYNKEIDRYEINEEEAYWIRWIFEWFSQGISLSEIADRLNARGVSRSPIHKKEQKHGWHGNIVHKVLSNEFYYTGIKKMTWDGETFEGPIDPIISPEIAKKYLQRHLNYKSYPNGATKKPTLTQGLVYCNACNVRMNIGWKNNPKTKRGTIKAYAYYRCPKCKEHISSSDCAGSIGASKLDKESWEKLWQFISNKDALNRAIKELTEKLEETGRSSEIEIKETEKKIEELAEERREVITLRRKKIITESDLAEQLETISSQEMALKHSLNEVRIASSYKSDKLVETINLFVEQINTSYSVINKTPRDEEEALKQFYIKQRLIRAYITRIDVFKDKSFKVTTEINLGSDSEQNQLNKMVGINNPPSQLEGTDNNRIFPPLFVENKNSVFDNKETIIRAIL